MIILVIDCDDSDGFDHQEVTVWTNPDSAEAFAFEKVAELFPDLPIRDMGNVSELETDIDGGMMVNLYLFSGNLSGVNTRIPLETW
jgi:hypothetical protein